MLYVGEIPRCIVLFSLPNRIWTPKILTLAYLIGVSRVVRAIVKWDAGDLGKI